MGPSARRISACWVKQKGSIARHTATRPTAISIGEFNRESPKNTAAAIMLNIRELIMKYTAGTTASRKLS